jgi:cation:H+ antiporter
VSGVGTAGLVLILLVAAALTWWAGGLLSRTTDALDARFGLGSEIGGVILLAVAGSLPELAITVSAAIQGHLDIAAGNLIGGIAMQTMVLVLCDIACGERPLTYLVGALTPVLEGMLVVLVVSGVLLGALLPQTTAIGGVVSPASLFIVIVWVGGIYVINRVRKTPRWTVDMPGSHPGRRHRAQKPTVDTSHPYHEHSTRFVLWVFGSMCAVTLVAGVFLEITGNELADRAGINGAIFGATVLAGVTALPEISSGIAAVKLGDNALAIGDIFGGNAFQVCLFLVADLIAGKPVLPEAGRLNSWLASVGVMLTAIYAIGVVARPYKGFGRVGPDSLVAIVLFGLGIGGLFLLPP